MGLCCTFENSKQIRTCKRCGKVFSEDAIDACMNELPRVENACCGHGVIEMAYIKFNDGSLITGEAALDYIRNRG